jgi:signal transduction histidine kinase
MVEEMDGSIEVESEVSRGTTFRIAFPRYDDQEM